MQSLLEKAKEHFAEIVRGEGLYSLSIPEWGEPDQPAILYYRPLAALPVKTYSRWVALGSEQTVEAFVEMLILRCLDASGQPIFKALDKTEMLREISPLVVCRIITQISEGDNLPSLDEAKKNS
jgi:hypothetical protein